MRRFKVKKETGPLSQENLCKCGDESEVHNFEEGGFFAPARSEQIT